ncbi:hypothetical protein PF003_g39842 [Phytophthora fragariae]|nr:hypothetical protein PF003_g39842 [Phytophthora fragariae]
MWVMDHSAGVEVVLGTDFMIPVGVRLDLFHATAQLPDEVKIPLVKTQSAADDDFGVGHVLGGPTEVLQIPKWESREFRLQRRQPTSDTHEIWIRGTQQLVPTVASFRRGQPDRVRLTNISERLIACPCHLPVVLWVPVGDLPRDKGYVRLDSRKYKEWQVLAFSECRNSKHFEKERRWYEEWLSEQPPTVEVPVYARPRGLRQRPADASSDEDGRLTCAQRWERLLQQRSDEDWTTALTACQWAMIQRWRLPSYQKTIRTHLQG